jgi:hypothetical protein
VFDCDSPEEAKQEITDAIHYCLHLLQKDKYITDHVSNSISSRSKKMGNEIENMILNMIQDFSLVEEEELLTAEEWQHPEADDEPKEVHQRENEEEEEESEGVITSSGDSYGEPSPKKPHVSDLVPLDVKIKAVTLAQLHPTWSVKTISSKTSRLLTSKMQLWRWKEQVERGGSDRDKYNMINSWTYDRFTEARA